jgi:hypothetical protein
MKVTPAKHLRNAHHYLILHGRYTCVAQKPLCWKCPVYEPCEFKEKKKFAALNPDAPRRHRRSRCCPRASPSPGRRKKPLMFNPTRDQARTFLFDLWEKHRSGAALTSLESLALSVLLEHPEYHAVLGESRALPRPRLEARGAARPTRSCTCRCTSRSRSSFPSTSRRESAPPLDALARRKGSEHDARHEIMECLAENALAGASPRHGFDNAAYLACLAKTGRRGLAEVGAAVHVPVLAP